MNIYFKYILTSKIELPRWRTHLPNAGDKRHAGLIPGSARSPREGHGNPFQYSCLENPMDRGAWQSTVHKVTNSQTQLKQLNTHTRKHEGLKTIRDY